MKEERYIRKCHQCHKCGKIILKGALCFKESSMYEHIICPPIYKDY